MKAIESGLAMAAFTAAAMSFSIAGVVARTAAKTAATRAQPSRAPEAARVKTAAQAIATARRHVLNGRRGIRYRGAATDILNWNRPGVSRFRSRQGTLLWEVKFEVSNVGRGRDGRPVVNLPGDSFSVVVTPGGQIAMIIQAYD